MKLMKWFGALIILVLAAMFPLACSNSGNPANPSHNGGPTPTHTSAIPTVTCPTNGICAVFVVQRVGSTGSTLLNMAASVSVLGAPVSTAGVTVDTPSNGSIPLTWSSSSYSAGASWTYVPGGVYTIHLTTSIGPASASCTAVGGITVSPNGQSTTWAYDGNEDIMDVALNGNFVYLSLTDLDPPVNLPASDFSTPGDYMFMVDCNGISAYSKGATVIESQTSDELFTDVIVGTPTPTLSPTITLTSTWTPGSPTATPTSTPTATPTATDMPLSYTCSSDTTTGMPVSGSVTTIGYGCDFVPLCNGWVLTQDQANKKIDLLYAPNGSVSQAFTLSDTPGNMVYDSAASNLYVCLKNTAALARVNINTGTVTNISLANSTNNPAGAPASFLALVPGGKVFAEMNVSTYAWWDVPLALVNGTSGTVLQWYYNTSGSYDLDQGQIAYDSLHDQLLLNWAEIPSSLYLYSYNSSSSTLNPNATVTFGIGDASGMSLSPDQTHLAVSEQGTGIVDYLTASGAAFSSPGTFTSSWYATQAGDYSQDTTKFLTFTGSNLVVYNVSDHATTTASHSVSLGSYYAGVSCVGFSKGGGLIYDLVSDNQAQTCRLDWYLYP